jgi:hypothetical protein
VRVPGVSRRSNFGEPPWIIRYDLLTAVFRDARASISPSPGFT